MNASSELPMRLIASAPKDGTPIMACWTKFGYEDFTAKAIYVDGKWTYPDKIAQDEAEATLVAAIEAETGGEERAKLVISLAVVRRASVSSYETHKHNPTHWRVFVKCEKAG